MSGMAWIPPRCRCGELATSRAAGCAEWMCGTCSDRWIEEHPAEFRRAMDERHGRCPECRCAQGHKMDCSRASKRPRAEAAAEMRQLLDEIERIVVEKKGGDR